MNWQVSISHHRLRICENKPICSFFCECGYFIFSIWAHLHHLSTEFVVRFCVIEAKIENENFWKSWHWTKNLQNADSHFSLSFIIPISWDRSQSSSAESPLHDELISLLLSPNCDSSVCRMFLTPMPANRRRIFCDRLFLVIRIRSTIRLMHWFLLQTGPSWYVCVHFSKISLLLLFLVTKAAFFWVYWTLKSLSC